MASSISRKPSFCPAKNGISVNAISAFYHDHLFIEKDKAEQAQALLEELSKQ